MSKELFRRLEGMKASYPFLNPNYKGGLPNKEKVCEPIADSLKARERATRYPSPIMREGPR